MASRPAPRWTSLPRRSCPSGQRPLLPTIPQATPASLPNGWLPSSSPTRQATLASIILLDRDGRIAGGTAERGSDATLPEVASALAGVPRTVMRRNASYRSIYRFDWLSRAAATRIHYARPILVGGRVVGAVLLSRSARSLFVGLYEDWGKIAIGVLAILAALVLLSGLLSRGIARPIEDLREAVKNVAAGRGALPDIPKTAAIEIQDLYRDFAAMAAAIELRSRYLRDVAHAVSHEFKTPLAGIRGAIELLQDHADAMSPNERHSFLANADADATRLTLLVSRLLDLARADMTTAGPGGEVDVVAVARTLADTLRTRTMAIMIDVDASPVWVAVPETTLEAALTTLIENSAQAGARAVTIVVRPGDEATDPITITVTDDGSGIAAADMDRIFEPFFTSRRAIGGTGLGLPIARSLLAASGGELRMVDATAGAAFQLHLPRSR